MSNQKSELVATVLGITYPFIMILGFYIILNGHAAAGGGFHGGAVLSTVYIVKYLITPEEDYMITRFQHIEKMLILMLIVFPILFMYLKIEHIFPFARSYYLIGIDFLIGIEVMCALSILFFRFVFYETR